LNDFVKKAQLNCWPDHPTLEGNAQVLRANKAKPQQHKSPRRQKTQKPRTEASRE
jgi:hypothetical protein